MENRSNKEIATDMNITVKTVEAQITKALKHIKAHLGKGYHYLLSGKNFTWDDRFFSKLPYYKSVSGVMEKNHEGYLYKFALNHPGTRCIVRRMDKRNG